MKVKVKSLSQGQLKIKAPMSTRNSGFKSIFNMNSPGKEKSVSRKSLIPKFHSPASQNQNFNLYHRDTTHLKDIHSKIRSSSQEFKFPIESNEVLFSSNPTGRQEVRNLKSWFSKMTLSCLSQVLEEEKLMEMPAENRVEKMVLAGQILVSGIKEIVRQVSVDCRDRGEVLLKIFDNYALYANLSLKLQETNSTQLVNHLRTKLNRVEAKFQRKTQELLGEIDDLKLEISEKNFIINTKESEIGRLKNSSSESKREGAPKNNTLRPLYSKSRVTQKDINIYESFYKSKSIQVFIEPIRTDKSVLCISPSKEAEMQTEDVKLLNSSLELSRDEIIEQEFSDSGDVPKSIIVTTEKNENILEYAYVSPNSGLKIDIPPREASRSHDETFSQISLRSSEDLRDLDSSFLITPDIEISEEIKEHSHNPDPFTEIEPTPDISFLHSPRTKHRRVKLSNKEVQTDPDLILENEENELLDQMISYKNELLRKASQELIQMRSKLVKIKRQHTTVEETLAKMEENLVHKKDVEVNTQENNTRQLHPAVSLLEKFSVEKYNKLSKKMLLKKLNLIYTSALSKEETGEKLPNLLEYVYYFIQNRHSDLLVGDKKYLELLHTALKNADHLRCAIFIRLAGLGQRVDLTDYVRPNQAFAFYIKLIGKITRSKTGIVLGTHDNGEVQYIPKVRAVECIKESFKDMFSNQYIQFMVAGIERASKNDPMKINTNGVVNLDFMLDLAMEEYNKHSADVYNAVSVIAEGFDLEKIGRIHVYEVEMALWHIRGVKFQEILEIAHKNFVLVDDLIDLCVNRSLISMNDVNEYLSALNVADLQASDIVKSNLFRNVAMINKVFVNKDQLGISDEIEKIWKNKIRLIEEDVLVNPKALYLGFTIFIKELTRLANSIRN